MSKPVYYDAIETPKVQPNVILALDNSTHGYLEINRSFTPEEREFLLHAQKNMLLRKLDPYKTTFKEELAKDKFEIRHMMDLFCVMGRVLDSKITFNAFSGRRFTYDEAVSIGRGLGLLLQLDIFNQTPIETSKAFLLVAIKNDGLIRLTMDGTDDVKIEKGWLAPVWSEREISIW